MNTTQTQPHLPVEPENNSHRGAFHWKRLFGEMHPYDSIVWEKRTAKIERGDGTIVFEQKDVEVPNFWTQTATDIVASKYFRGKLGTPVRETSARQMVDRVVTEIRRWGLDGNYFASSADADNFAQDLTWILINQYAAFNSPVWFNVGTTEHPQCSACFILAVEDNMDSILKWGHDEGKIFQGGSGSGASLSKLRGSMESLSKGGTSSGPVSFMKLADAVANSIRSGGKTRRAAKMVVLDVSHPDIKDFINCKQIAEDMVKILTLGGVKNSLTGDLFDPYTMVPFQNANNSVRVTDEFMEAVEADVDWNLTARVDGKVIQTVKAREIMNWIADAAWSSADPGMQYDTTINSWNTVSNTGRINASNPCSEYMHLDNSACNLASLNLMKFLKEGAKFDVDLFKKVVDVMILAQEILVTPSSYPTPEITDNAEAYRELGLGYANLGSLLMVLGMPYDSDMGRYFAANITSLMSGEAYRMSALIADSKGPFSGYAKNREPMLSVLKKHLNAAEHTYNESILGGMNDEPLQNASRQVWHDALELAEKYGVRNSQISVLAPTGTIAFLMDCQTTGVEPDIALVKYKKLVGGGVLKLVNNQVSIALRRLDYSNQEVEAIIAHITEHDTIEGAPHIKEKDLAVFDCAFKAANGERSISYMGHLLMMAAVQPFISGAISKTINLPSTASVDDVKDVFMQGWKLGLKAIALYRDGCKTIQPLNMKKDEDKEATSAAVVDPFIEKINGYTRRKLPDDRPAFTHKFNVGGHEGYLNVGFYPDTMKPGETFITVAKEGSTFSGLLDTIATLISVALQSGVPLKVLVRKFKDMRFDPSGFTENPDIPTAKSIVDYVFRYLGMKYLSREDKEELFGPEVAETMPDFAERILDVKDKTDSLLADLITNKPVSELEIVEEIKTAEHHQPGMVSRSSTDAPICQCGTLMVRAGACYSCPNCFATTGVCN
ncbi:MAG: ribonucleoside-diphosphate reductase, adenosylcobalamin-dependent [Candidatus Yanofskybacteria bacterium RIFCSPHIGHO2_01_FULL_41_21]|uniref:Vitamin B12-dependent ribonucleotide reductase n=1 Tax=Candidatus Yanofskybacteria bacterium RIFCSPHIGHO2_01_FULL_41_21 TaxID=1802660 RepID=A0A1F8EAR9_9BACT|nr:MAG: ribonucleoside-diphosphate reductase, adenosylcobalamin-dependent [Candidatus Yanofskybacteria bacterium RIFCSPHIGHO2_01_FULL_41_21]